MYISNLQQLLDETGNIQIQMTKEAREFAIFLALAVDATTKTLPSTLTSTDIHCFKKGCSGIIKSALRPNKHEIHWYCPDCENEGVISEWQKTKWDNWKLRK